jgi:hypothetical protein
MIHTSAEYLTILRKAIKNVRMLALPFSFNKHLLKVFSMPAMSYELRLGDRYMTLHLTYRSLQMDE